MKLSEALPVKRGKSVSDINYSYNGHGAFNVYSRRLYSLRGSPTTVRGDFDCGLNSLTDLVGSPTYVEGDFDCSSNELITLAGATPRIDGMFDCSKNPITSLIGGPKKVGGFYIADNIDVRTLEGIATHIGGYLSFDDCQNLRSLKNIHKMITRINGTVHANCGLTSNILGLLLIEGVNHIYTGNADVERIMNIHLGKGMAGVLEAQEQLLDAGYGKFAQL